PYRKDDISGIVKYYHKNGQLESQGKMYGRKKSGKWSYFDEKGKKIKDEIWKRGEVEDKD
ncbi:MAG: hypothetical protein EAZ97_00690, partial [Bacteroidetes bacterium]